MATKRPAEDPPAIHTHIDQVRALWLEKQALARPSTADVAAVVRDAGWLASAGGQCAYLALRARRPDLGRADVDRGVFAGRALLELPGPRGVAMLVPAGDAGLALGATRAFDDARYARVKKAEGLRDDAVDRLAVAIREALRGGPLGPDNIRAAVPARLVKSLGEAGKKLGDATTLPIALRRLQVAGEVVRTSATGRLDAGRYVYARFEPSPLAAPAPPDDLAAVLGARFFGWAGPASRSDFASWAGLSQSAAKTAMARLPLVRVEADGLRDELWLLAADAPALERADPGPGRFVLVPFRDNYLAFRRSLTAIVDPALFGRAPALLGDTGRLHHHLILDRGRVVGAWEYDPGARGIAWGAFAKLSAAERRAVAAEVETMSAFVRDELGDARFYALDNERNRTRRLAAVRALPVAGR